jgi:outer membrane protein
VARYGGSLLKGRHTVRVTRISAAIAICGTLILAGAAVRADAANSNPPKLDITAETSLSLADALQLALANNLTYQAAAQDVSVAEARVIQAGAGRVPSLSAGYSFVHTQNAAFFNFQAPGPGGKLVNKPIFFSATYLNNVDATLKYALYSGGTVQAAIGQAAAGLSAAQSTYAAQRATVIRDVTNAYFQLIESQRGTAIADQTVAVANANLKTANDGLSAGTLAKADVLRQEVSLANAQVRDIQASSGASLANATLANLLNVNLGSQIRPTEELAAATPSFSLSDVLADATSHRYEIGAARAAVDIADSAVKAARSGSLPAVVLQVSDASSKPNFENVPQPQLSETLAVTWKLFDGGLTHGKVAEATADVEKAKINLKQLSNGIDLEVRQAYFNYTAAQAQVGANKAGQDAADESLRVSQIRFKSGVGTSLELADALLADESARTDYVNAQANLRIALTALQRAAGLL